MGFLKTAALSLCFSLLWITNSMADGGISSHLNIVTQDGTTCNTYPYKVIFPNSSCVDNGNGTVNINVTGGGSGSSSSSLAVGTGTTSGFVGPITSSPTPVLLFNSAQFNGSLQGGGTFYATLNTSSVTLQGQNVINLTSTLQSGATFYVSSGTIGLGGLNFVDGSTMTNLSPINGAGMFFSNPYFGAGKWTFSNYDQGQGLSFARLQPSGMTFSNFYAGTGSGSWNIEESNLNGNLLFSDNGGTGLKLFSFYPNANAALPVFNIGENTTTNLYGLTSSSITVSSETITGGGGLTVDYGVYVGSVTGGGLATCGDSTHALGYNGSNLFTCQNVTGSGGGGGSSSLAIGTGTTSGFVGPIASSPTAVALFNKTQFTVALQGSATAYISAISTGIVTVASLNTAQPGILDCTAYAGADFGAKVNACIAALPASGGVASLLNFTGVQYIGTQIVIPSNVLVLTGGATLVPNPNGITISGNNAGISGLPAQITPMTDNGANNMITVTGNDDYIGYLAINVNGFSGYAVYGSGCNRTILEHDYIQQYAAGGVYFTSCNDTRLYSDDFVSSGASTGPAVAFSTGREVVDTVNVTNTGPTTAFHAIGQTTLNMVNSIIASGSGHDALDADANASIFLMNNNIAGGTGYHALLATGAVVEANGGNQFSATCGDAVYMGGNYQRFTNNLVTMSASSCGGYAGIHVKYDTIGETISNNKISFSAGETPTSANYGIWMDTSYGGHFILNQVSGNRFAGAVNNYDYGVFFDNSSGNTTANGGTIENNDCVDLNTLHCITRSDSGNLSGTVYRNNTQNVGYPYGIAGSNLDLITGFSVIFSSLPNAGNGSFGYCTDCQGVLPLTGGGSGAFVTVSNSTWTILAGLNGNIINTSVLESGTTFYVSSGSVSGQETVGTLQGAGLATCGDSTHALNWASGSFGCQSIPASGGGGGSTLAVTTGSTVGFSTVASSPTAIVLFDQSQFMASLQGGATAFITIAYSTDSKSISYTAKSTDTVVEANCASACTITLPTAVGISGKVYFIKIIGAGTATIATTSAQTIDGSTTVIPNPNQYAEIEVLSNGSNWEIL